MALSTAWQALVAELAVDNPLLGGFGKTIDEIATETLRAANLKVPPFKYSPLLIEPLLGDIAELLDRCVQYRSLASELEIAAVQQVLARELEVSLYAIDTDLVAMTSLAEEYANDGKRREAIASKYDSTGVDDLGKRRLLDGKAEGERASAAHAGELAALEKKKLEKVNERLLAIKRHADRFHARTVQAGSAHNYAERFDRTMIFFKEDLVEAYHKALCVRVGLKHVFGKDDPLPEVADAQLLDKMLLWCRRVLRYVEWVADNEIEFDVLVPLRWEYRLDGQKSIVNGGTYRATLQTDDNTVDVKFSLPKEMFGGLDRLRLRSVGLSVSFPGPVNPFDLQTRDNFIFWMELQSPPFVAGDDEAMYFRPKLVFRNVRVDSPDRQPDWASPTPVRNIDPTASQGWTLSIARSVIQLLSKDAANRKTGDATADPLPANVNLHLSVAGLRPSSGSAA